MKKQILLTCVCCCSIFCTQAQDNWTLPGPASNPQFSFNESMATLGGDKVLEFGFYGETWVYDLSDNTWTSINPSTSPTGRIAHVMANIGGDMVLLFGGTSDFDNFIPNNETWIYDLSDNTWTLRTPLSSPAARLSTAMAYAGGDHAILYGGDGGATETWQYDLSANTWTLMNPSSNPGSQVSHAMASLDEDRVLLFAGSAGTNLTWVYDLSDNSWTQMSPGTEPPARAISAMASLGGDRVLLFGGLLFGFSAVDETWLYDYGDNLWTLLSPSFSPSERYGHAMASITTDHVLLFGGIFDDISTYLFTASPEPCPAEICNGIDDDCDGVIDDGVKTKFFLDSDNDGFGNASVFQYSCEQPSGYTGTGTDCNDSNSMIYPDAPEIADGKDNDCDGLIDEGLSTLSIEAGDCEVAYLGYGPVSCATLSVSVNGGTAPYAYLWSNGATTSLINVCPEETTIYTVVVTDHNGFSAQDVVTVQVIDIRCGNNNNKVLVCHIPPGNPNNPQIICIAPSAVQAHLDHGDYLGVCSASNPCEEEGQGIGDVRVVESPVDGHPVSVTTDLIETVKNEGTFSLIPNPADEKVFIQVPNLDQSYQVAIFDISGKVVQFADLKTGDQTLSTTVLTDGVYFVQVRSSANVYVESLVIVHNK